VLNKTYYKAPNIQVPDDRYKKKKNYMYTTNCIHYTDVLVCTTTKKNSGSFFDHYPPGKMSMWALLTA
jgi:hypothetical protein